MTAPSAPQDPTVAGDAAPLGPLTFVQTLSIEGHAAVARLHDEALAVIAALADGWNSPVEEGRVLRMSQRPTLDSRPVVAAAA